MTRCRRWRRCRRPRSSKVRERAGVSQAVLAGFLNVAVNTVSQWERGERRPTGAALKLCTSSGPRDLTRCGDEL